MELDINLENFKKKAKTLELRQADFEKYLEPEQIDSDMDSAMQYENQVMHVLLEAGKKRDILCKESDEELISLSSAKSTSFEAKLPKMELPKFSGNVHDYMSFWEQFEEAVNKKNIPDVTKFSYLRRLLDGEAKAAISGLSLTSANYTTACRILENGGVDQNR